MIQQQTSLYFTDARSDKVYNAEIIAANDGFLVNFSYGKRNASLRQGTKTQAPVALEKAQSIFDKLVRSKTSKGYTEQANGSAYTSETRNDESSGFICQLLNPIDDDEADCLIENDNFIMQRKYDGVRLSIEYKNGEVRGINRKGLYVGISTTIETAYKALAEKLDLSSFLVDGEGLGDKHAVFDILELNGKSLKALSYQQRFTQLISLVPDNERHTQDAVFLVDYATNENKQAFYDDMRANKREGVVFKHLDAAYEPGRPNTLGSQLKSKFYKSASVIVQSINDKRSIAMMVFDNHGSEQFAGNLTIPANADIPNPGEILEVRYLYAMKSHSLYQPTYIWPRNDIDASECLLSQFEYKREELLQ